MKTAENKIQNQKENKNLITKEYKMKSIVTIILAVILTANLNAQWDNDYNSYGSSSSSLYDNFYNNSYESNNLSSGWSTQSTTIRPYKDVYGNSYSNQSNLWKDQDNDGLVGYYDNNDRNSDWGASTKVSTNYNSTPTYNSNKTIQTGSRGGQYYINSNGNKTYIKKTNAWGY